MIPGPEGIVSPIRTRAIPLIFTEPEPPGPMGSGYGTPDTEFTIWQMLVITANGMPFAVANVCGIVVMTPLSGGPAAPGLTITAQPMETGAPGIVDPLNWAT
jgi:hypothetical protein